MNKANRLWLAELINVWTSRLPCESKPKHSNMKRLIVLY